MKLSDQLFTAPVAPFEGLFGVFADSQPDGWGRLLFDRAMAAEGILSTDISTIQRLSYIGNSGMGALSYSPVLELNSDREIIKGLDEIATSVAAVLKGSPADLLEELYQMGGSSGGARPKILVGFNPETEHLLYGQEILPEGYEHWLIKFPSSYDRPDIAAIEYTYHKMAVLAGLEMSECRLFKGASGTSYFGTKRFDKVGNSRIHMHSVAGLLHDNFRLSNLDYGHVMDAAFHLEKDVKAYEKILRIAAFNIFSSNQDDHSKNISFLMDERGVWQVAPAYDLTFSTSFHGMHSMMVAGESKKPTTTHLMKLAEYFKVKDAKSVIEQVRYGISKWEVLAKEAGLSASMRKSIAQTLATKK